MFEVKGPLSYHYPEPVLPFECAVCRKRIAPHNVELLRSGFSIKLLVHCHGKVDAKTMNRFDFDDVDCGITFFRAERRRIDEALDAENRYGETVSAVVQSEIL